MSRPFVLVLLWAFLLVVLTASFVVKVAERIHRRRSDE